MTTTHECRCGRPTAGAWVCERCAKTLEVAVANIGVYHADLDTLRTKRERYGSGAATKGSIGKAQPLGMDARFAKAQIGSEIDHDTRNTVVAWCRTVMEEQPELVGPHCRHACLHVSCGAIFRRRYPRDTIQSMSAYLLRQLRWIVGQQWCEDMLDELLDVEQRLARLIDRPPDRWYAGKCSAPIGDDDDMCPAELYAVNDKGSILCHTCGERHDVAQRRDFLLKEARAVHVTATEAASALLAWTDYDGSETKLVDLIRKWRDSERLDVADVTSLLGKDRHLYRLGDIQDLLVEHAQRKQRRLVDKSA